MRLSRGEFEELVVTALAGVPEEFREKLENIEIVVEDWPAPEDRGNLPKGTLLLGVYRGVPLTGRSAQYPPLFPDRIAIFQGSIERVCRSRQEMVQEVRRTVLHEIAHYFGISDERLREIGC